MCAPDVLAINDTGKKSCICREALRFQKIKVGMAFNKIKAKTVKWQLTDAIK